MAKLIADSHYDIGGYRDVYEDRVCTRFLTTAGGLKLVIAAVADGVGGENKGERAAQTAIDALLSYLIKSKENDHPALLTHAVQFANKAVFQLQRETRGSSTTLSVAMLDESTHRLFIANVGDSRIYICRNQKLTQLTIDHSFANEMAWRGQISAEAARSHPRANVLMRAIGAKEQVEVDLGFYVGTTDYTEANARGLEGLPLQDGDAILVCSDGLIKDSLKTHEPLITTEEIVHTLRDKEGKKAAQELISFALGRGPDDNISAAVIQMPDRWRGLRARRPLIYAGIAIIGLVVVLGFVWNTLRGTTKELTEIAQRGTAVAQEMTVVAGFTPTPTNTGTPAPTPTPSPTLPPPIVDQVALILPGSVPLLLRQPYTVDAEAVEMKIYASPDMAPQAGYLYAMPATLLVFDSAEDPGSNQGQTFALRMGSTGGIFLETGGYSQAYLGLIDNPVDFSLQGCFAIHYTEDLSQVQASCYAGVCKYNNLKSGVEGEILEGKQLVFEEAGMPAGDLQEISNSEASEWASRLKNNPTAYDCAHRYIPTPTARPQPTDTATSPPAKPGSGKPANSPTSPPRPPQPTNTSRPQPSNTSPPQPTNTARPQPSNTSPPQPTNTPKPPTDTSKPPTDTPKPPTNTPKPPTDTPLPKPPTHTPKPTNTPKPPKPTEVIPPDTPQPTDT